MEHINYKIEKGDTLESIAKEHNIRVNELLDFHNSKAKMTQQFYSNEIPFYIEGVFIPPKKEEELPVKEYTFEEKYRCEQTVVTKLNGIPTNTAITKREFQVKKTLEDEDLLYEVSILDNIIEVNPNQYQEAIDLVADLDLVKCNEIVLQINKKTGEVEKIVNHQDIIQKWNEHKNKLESKYDFVRNPDGQEAVKNFIETSEKQITIEKTLIEDLRSKMFFEVFFNKYLVNADDKMEKYTKTLYSQLFTGQKIELEIRQDLLRESEKQILIRKVSSIKDSLKKSSNFEKMYEEKYKPILQYKFSEYNASYRERVVYNEDLHIPNEGEVTIIEEVKNNIQLMISYNYKKIE